MSPFHLLPPSHRRRCPPQKVYACVSTSYVDHQYTPQRFGWETMHGTPLPMAVSWKRCSPCHRMAQECYHIGIFSNIIATTTTVITSSWINDQSKCYAQYVTFASVFLRIYPWIGHLRMFHHFCPRAESRLGFMYLRHLSGRRVRHHQSCCFDWP